MLLCMADAILAPHRISPPPVARWSGVQCWTMRIRAALLGVPRQALLQSPWAISCPLRPPGFWACGNAPLPYKGGWFFPQMLIAAVLLWPHRPACLRPTTGADKLAKMVPRPQRQSLQMC